MHVGFIGLGHLGMAVAGRLIDCGHELTVWNRSKAATEKVFAETALSPADLSRRTRIIFLCLFDSTAVRQVLTGKEGLLQGAPEGKIFIDLTTNHYRDVEHFHCLTAEAGAAYLEAPVLGSVIPAAGGALTVLVSGNRTTFDDMRPLLENIGKNLFFLEQPGLATKMKLINNLVLGSFMAVIAESLGLGEKVGLDREKVLEILSVGGGNSLVLNAKKEKLLHEDFSTHFSNALIYKDLHLLQEMAYENRKALFTGAVAKELFALACQQGLDKEDFSSIYKLFQEKGTPAG